jgi:hypothetical protein
MGIFGHGNIMRMALGNSLQICGSKFMELVASHGRFSLDFDASISRGFVFFHSGDAVLK